MEQPFSTSKVTVEYSDPHGVYKLLAPGLVPQLPLRNLHWQSHAGPLRSIDTLHVELLPAGSTDLRPLLSPDSFFPGQTSGSDSSTSRTDDGFQTQIGGQGVAVGSGVGAVSPGGTGTSNIAPGATASNASIDKIAASSVRDSTPTRRHQIPGLRRTPYLKVLLVRCDDNDTYKATVRQEIRDWIKANTSSWSSGSKKSTAENHDAFEWLVIHVVIPNTVAATQPRLSGKSETSEKPSATSRWRSSSTTLLEKLRSDFNSSSKGAIDRVAQVRIGINDVPYDILPRVVPAVPSGYKESPEETENAWADLISKFTSLILASFDDRVTQYEDDIKERDAQRSLPGWNFCTFFILKEGLARGFESVGLVEDALVGYDELSVGLDMIIQEQGLGNPGATANALLTTTSDLGERVAKAKAALYGHGDVDEVVDMQASDSTKGRHEETFDEIPISPTKKPYRDLIVESNVSVFDFRCYIFARQVALLLRLGNAWSTREELLAKLKEQQESVLHGVAPRTQPKQTEPEHENLSMLAEICRRTLEFIPAVSQVMRMDLQASLAENAQNGDGAQKPREPAMVDIMDNLVASFAFSIAQQMLAQTSTKALPIPPSTLAPPDGHEPKSAIPEPKTMMHPARSSSLRISTAAPSSGRPPPSPNFFPGPGQTSHPEGGGTRNQGFLKAGLEELAAKRAELYALSRNILEEAGKKRQWSDGWSSVPVVSESSMIDLVEIDLNDDHHYNGAPSSGACKEPAIVSMAGIESALLRTALDNSDDFYRLYETLTDKALRHYTVASNVHSVQACMADLAVLKYHVGDWSAASSYFWRTTPFYGESGWTLLELSMLMMYSKCLRELKRKDEYVKVVLKLLAKSASAELERQEYALSIKAGKNVGVQYPDSEAIKGFLDDLLIEANNLDKEVRVPLGSLFDKTELDGTLQYHDERDSFSIHVELTSLLVDELKIDKARARLMGLVGGVQRELWLELPEFTTLQPGRNRIKLNSSTIVPGTYEVDKLELTSGCLVLYRDQTVPITHFQLSSSIGTDSRDLHKTSKITVYQRTAALDVRLLPSHSINLGRNNTVDVELNAGWNSIKNAELRVKAATGGLRLLTAEAQLADSAIPFSKPQEGGLFFFDNISPSETIRIRIPYTVEQDVLSVSARIEVAYTTDNGTFQLSKTPSVPVALALGVNVQDVFKHDALHSRFTVSTATSSPLKLFKSELIGSDAYDTKFGVPPANPITILPRQPASLLYRIQPRQSTELPATSERTLCLKLHYTVVLDDVCSLVETSIIDTLRSSPWKAYTRLLVDTVLPHVRADLDDHSLERATLLGAMSTEYLKTIHWPRELGGLGSTRDGKSLADVLSDTLRAWQTNNPTIALTGEHAPQPRSIIIPVEIPSVKVVHTADIRLAPLSPGASVNGVHDGESTDIGPPVTTNQLLPATLHLKWTRIWDMATPRSKMGDMEFSYEVLAPGDSWLIGGRRKGHFVIPAPDVQNGPDRIGLSSTVETEADIPLQLIPQREGWLPYPSIEIKEVRSSDSATVGEYISLPDAGGLNGEVGDGESSGQCETDLRNLGETVRVVTDREKVTLSLDASGSGGGPLVLDVSRREWARMVV